MSTAYDRPGTDELEISLFGPGYGESLVVHYGNNRWFTVDSCLEDDRVTPTAIAYLRRLGVDAARFVTHNVITHPDGDHIGGISALFDACETATLVCPVVLTEKQMLSYVSVYARTDPTPLTQTTRELHNVLKKSTERPPGLPLYVKQDTRFIDCSSVRVTALAPSDSKIHTFLTRVSLQVPMAKADRRAPGQLLPNDVSAALLFEAGSFAAVFGADLEESPGQGWTTILENSVAFRNAERPGVFKVAHHGSRNADCAELWRAMSRPVAILSPFKRGSIKIPTGGDIARINSYTKAGYSTSSFRSIRMKRLSRVDQVLRRHNIRRQALYPKNGHVRLRINLAGIVSVKLFGEAVRLSDVY